MPARLQSTDFSRAGTLATVVPAMASGYDPGDETPAQPVETGADVEIVDYLQALGRRALVLVCLPAATALVALMFVAMQPLQYQAGATVAAPALIGGVSEHQYRGADATKSFVTTFQAGLRSAPIVDRTSAETGVPASRVRAGLHASGIGTSSFVKVTYSTPKRKEAKKVVQAAAGQTLRFLFSSQVNAAQAAVDVAQTQLDKTQSGLVAFSQQTGVADPATEYETVSDGISDLETLAARRAAHGDSTGAAQAQAEVDAKNARLAQLAQLESQYSTLVDHRRRAVKELDVAEQHQRQAASQLAAADPASVVTLGKVRHVIPVSQAIKATLFGGAIGVLLAVAVVLVLEVAAGVRRPVAMRAGSPGAPLPSAR
jgi:capsular polysaccharide biosynthesis protein